jgi:FeS assembly SUF system protein
VNIIDTTDASAPELMALHRNDGQDTVACAGERLGPGAVPADHRVLLDALRTVYDPEIPVNIVDLGLIYRLDVDEHGDVLVEMTLTAPACPVAGEMPRNVAETLSRVDGTGRVEVRLVWEPPWSHERMADDARLALGLF